MRKIYLYLVLIIIAFSSCKNNTSKLTDSIPSSAILVQHIDTKSLLGKADYNPVNNELVKNLIEEQKNSASTREKEMMEQFENLLRDPNSSGIDLIEDCFMYIDTSSIGILYKMNDEKKLYDMLTKTLNLPSQMIEKEGGNFIIPASENVVFCWNKHKFLFMLKFDHPYYDNSSESLKETAIKRLNQKGSESISSNKAFKQFINNKKDISIFYSNKNMMSVFLLETYLKNNFLKLYSDFYDNSAKLYDGINYGCYTSFEKGEIKFDLELLFESDEAEKRYKEIMQKMYAELKTDHLKLFSETPLLLFSAGANGDEFINFYNDMGLIPAIDEQFGDDLSKLGIDLKSLISDINGDITIAMNKIENKTKIISTSYGDEEFEYSVDNPIPEITVLVDLKETNGAWNVFQKLIAENDINELFVENGNTAYVANIEGIDIYIGIERNIFYITNQEDMYNNIINNKKYDNDFASQAKGASVFMCGNLASLKPLVVEGMADDFAMQNLLLKGLNLCGNYYLTMSNTAETAGGKIIVADKSKNSLAVFCEYIDEIITAAIKENM
jgi:hypothetical protein